MVDLHSQLCIVLDFHFFSHTLASFSVVRFSAQSVNSGVLALLVNTNGMTLR